MFHNTPDSRNGWSREESASKSQLAVLQVCTVFAQLTVGGKWQGPHVFIVRLRDDRGAPMKGVRIQDNGPKAGLNGVDNGQIWFDHVRVPRDALLNRFADVAADGTYTSSIPSLTTRFGVVVGGLTVGECHPSAGPCIFVLGLVFSTMRDTLSALHIRTVWQWRHRLRLHAL